MTSSSRCIGRIGLTIAISLGMSTIARADWPTSRHDPERTGVSIKGSNIQKPAAYWRTRLGGSLGANQHYLGDVNQDGAADLLYVAGGSVTLADPKGIVLWQTASRGFQQIVAVEDLDGNGTREIVVSSTARVAVIDAGSGAIDWEEPADEIGTPGAFRVGDFDGDGRPDLWLDTCGCCAIESGSPGVIYGFAGGASTPKKLGTPPARGHCGATSNTLADLDGDGQLELISMGNDTATVFRGNGAVVATSETIPERAYLARCEAVNVDGLPGDELVCFTNTVYGGGGERGLFALGYHPDQVPALRLLWNVVVSPADGGEARAPTALTMDLDGDGQVEAVVTGKVDGAFTTYVFDALTGLQLATFPGVAAGSVLGKAAPSRWLLVTTDDQVSAVAFNKAPPTLTSAWTLSGQRLLAQVDWARARRSALAQTLIAPDLDDDGRADLLFGSPTEPLVLSAYTTSTGLPSLLGQYPLDAGVGASGVSTPIGVTGTTRVVVARNDGFVTLLDGKLAPENLSKEGTITLPGTYVGGYYTGPGGPQVFGRAAVAARLKPGDKADSLLVVDSRGDLLRVDPSGATNVAPAKALWRLPDTFGAGIRPAGAGPAAIGAYRRRHPVTDPPVNVIASIDPDGNEIANLALQRPPLWDVLPGTFAVDGSTGFVGLQIDGTLNTHITAMGAKGELLWQKNLLAAAGTQPIAAGDWDGDGFTDVAAVINNAHVYTGKTGAQIASGSDPITYFMPILADLGGGSDPEMLLQGGFIPVRALAHDLGSLWVSNGPNAPYPYGALAPCVNGSKVLLEGTFTTPSQLSLTLATGPSAGTTTTMILASGAVYPSVDLAVAAGATLGQLTDVAVSTNLDGQGKGATALVGSSDGYLYALEACTGALRWSLALGAPVGSPSLGDTDGDGADEILVSVADGYLYALKNEVLPAPAFVFDTDPPAGIEADDVDEITTVSTLYATWAPVVGATSYEVAVVSFGGTYLTSPTWVDVGLVTSVALAGLPLADGAKYLVGVRALSPMGRSPDTPSDGVIIHLPVSTGAGGGSTTSTTVTGTGGAGGQPDDVLLTGRSCSCATPGRTMNGVTPLGALVALVVAWGARRRRTTR